jgi:hypothetical protein
MISHLFVEQLESISVESIIPHQDHHHRFNIQQIKRTRGLEEYQELVTY